MPDKKALEEYLDIKAEIRDLARRIEKQNAEIVTDTVVGSSPEYPYTEHSVSIRGVMNDDRLQARRRTLIGKLREREEEIEQFIEALPHSRERRIARYRVFDGLSWKEIAAKMGYKYSETNVRRIFDKIYKNF